MIAFVTRRTQIADLALMTARPVLIRTTTETGATMLFVSLKCRFLLVDDDALDAVVLARRRRTRALVVHPRLEDIALAWTEPMDAPSSLLGMVGVVIYIEPAP